MILSLARRTQECLPLHRVNPGGDAYDPLYQHDGHRKFITPFVGNQITICDAFGFEIPEGCRPTYTSRKSTKGKRGRPAKPQTETMI